MNSISSFCRNFRDFSAKLHAQISDHSTVMLSSAKDLCLLTFNENQAALLFLGSQSLPASLSSVHGKHGD